MSTVSKSSAKKSRPGRSGKDPIRYGWREVTVKRPDGSEDFQQIPLTEEDILHPEEGDFIAQTDAHDSDRSYLKNVFKLRTGGEPDTVVIADCRVDWNLPGVKPLGPDVAVFCGVRRFIDWETFDVAAEGARPLLVVEITSRATRKNDLVKKVKYYHQAKVPLYVIADARGRGTKRRVSLIAYEYARKAYKPIAPDKKGRINLAAVRLWLGTTRDPRGGYDRLVCFDPHTGDELGDYAAVVEAAAKAREQARADAKALAEAEARIRQLEAELKQLRRAES
jgi:Uma2 family endonuclease